MTDRSLRASHTTCYPCSFKGRTGGSGTYDTPFPVTQSHLAVRSDIDEQGGLYDTVETGAQQAS